MFVVDELCHASFSLSLSLFSLFSLFSHFSLFSLFSRSRAAPAHAPRRLSPRLPVESRDSLHAGHTRSHAPQKDTASPFRVLCRPLRRLRRARNGTTCTPRTDSPRSHVTASISLTPRARRARRIGTRCHPLAALPSDAQTHGLLRAQIDRELCEQSAAGDE